MKRLAVILLLWAVGGCRSGGGTAAPVGVDDDPPGITSHTLALRDGGELRYSLLRPRGARFGRPLVLALHYGGTVTPFYGRGVLALLVAPALRELDAVMVAPDALEGGWTSGGSEAAVLALLDDLGEELHFDRTKVLVTGYSMGGVGTWYFAGRHPEIFSAAIPVAGRPVGPAPKIPLYVIHSRRDEVMPLSPTEEEVARLRAAGADVKLVVVEGLTHFETERFVEPLRAAVPWVQAVWARRPR